MRINVYSQELITARGDVPWETGYTDFIDSRSLLVTDLVTQTADTGVTYSAARLYLHSPSQLHSRRDDDDRSAITFWLPKSADRREYLATIFEDLAQIIRTAPPETGLD